MSNWPFFQSVKNTKCRTHSSEEGGAPLCCNDTDKCLNAKWWVCSSTDTKHSRSISIHHLRNLLFLGCPRMRLERKIGVCWSFWGAAGAGGCLIMPFSHLLVLIKTWHGPESCHTFLILPCLHLFSKCCFFSYKIIGTRLVLSTAVAWLMYVAGLHRKELLLKAKCHQKKTSRVKLLDKDYKWITKM